MLQKIILLPKDTFATYTTTVSYILERINEKVEGLKEDLYDYKSKQKLDCVLPAFKAFLEHPRAKKAGAYLSHEFLMWFSDVLIQYDWGKESDSPNVFQLKIDGLHKFVGEHMSQVLEQGSKIEILAQENFDLDKYSVELGERESTFSGIDKLFIFNNSYSKAALEKIVGIRNTIPNELAAVGDFLHDIGHFLVKTYKKDGTIDHAEHSYAGRKGLGDYLKTGRTIFKASALSAELTEKYSIEIIDQLILGGQRGHMVVPDSALGEMSRTDILTIAGDTECLASVLQNDEAVALMGKLSVISAISDIASFSKGGYLTPKLVFDYDDFVPQLIKIVKNYREAVAKNPADGKRIIHITNGRIDYSDMNTKIVLPEISGKPYGEMWLKDFYTDRLAKILAANFETSEEVDYNAIGEKIHKELEAAIKKYYPNSVSSMKQAVADLFNYSGDLPCFRTFLQHLLLPSAMSRDVIFNRDIAILKEPLQENGLKFIAYLAKEVAEIRSILTTEGYNGHKRIRKHSQFIVQVGSFKLQYFVYELYQFVKAMEDHSKFYEFIEKYRSISFDDKHNTYVIYFDIEEYVRHLDRLKW